MARLTTLAIPPLTDPSEARYADLSKVMAQTGSWFRPMVWIDGELIPFKGKPPLGFWMMAASMRMFGYNEFAARLPSALSSLFLFGIMFLVLSRYLNNYIAWSSVFITATSASFFILSGATLVDSALSLFSMGAVFFYYAFLKEKQSGTKKLWSVLVFTFLGLAFITKGPVGIVYFGVPVFFWTLISGSWATLRNHAWFLGGSIFLLITVPCFLLMEKAMPGFLDYFFIHENLLRYTTKNYGDLYSGTKHTLPWGTAIPLTFVACLPWALAPF
ncbi:MAG: phospholipid carrier-dependent glycosyltransferase, partial [Kiritimatiellaeota bacterium]|nr:phospholipid carrier-dependent glycosyltransferase [Kiritimatiellota bacterium]